MNRESLRAGTPDTRPELTPDFGEPVLPQPSIDEECQWCGEPLKQCQENSFDGDCPEYKYAKESE